MLLSLNTNEAPDIAKVGGKAASLISLQQAGANVPAGIVLTSDYFAAWLDRVEASDAWREALSILAGSGGRQPDLATRTRLTDACDEAKRLAAGFELSEEQHSLLATVDNVGQGPYAVRSSSPEEDLVGASFAGQYETVLNVDIADVEEAIRTCFVSCLDSRVLLYKQEMKFERLTPAIAVVVQQQVASESSGVVFSLNPLTNDYDEIVVNASWGLGEALVSGDITPDSVVVSKVTGEIVEHRIGNKGGDRGSEACLDQVQIGELAAEVRRIEELFDTPVDVEWAFSDERLYVLQARPITAYVPMAPELLTEPGAPRRLYVDGYLTDGVTMSGPVSPMGSQLLLHLIEYMLAWAVGPLEKLRLDDYGIRITLSLIHI